MPVRIMDPKGCNKDGVLPVVMGPGGGRLEVQPSWARPALKLGIHMLQVDLTTLEKSYQIEKDTKPKGLQHEGPITVSLQYLPTGKVELLIHCLATLWLYTASAKQTYRWLCGELWISVSTRTAFMFVNKCSLNIGGTHISIHSQLHIKVVLRSKHTIYISNTFSNMHMHLSRN